MKIILQISPIGVNQFRIEEIAVEAEGFGDLDHFIPDGYVLISLYPQPAAPRMEEVELVA